MSKAILPIFGFLLAAMASGATLQIPSADGPLTINGLADEDIWKQAVGLPLEPVGFSAPFPAGGEMRAVVRGGYLCLSAAFRRPAVWSPDRLAKIRCGGRRTLSLDLHFHGFGPFPGL